MKLTSANKSAPDGLQYRAKLDGDTSSNGTRSIKWQRSPSGATHTGTAGEQRFVVMPDGRGTWILAETDREGVSHLLEHSLPSDWSAMAAALDYVHTPIRWPLRLLVAGALTVAVVAVHALATL